MKKIVLLFNLTFLSIYSYSQTKLYYPDNSVKVYSGSSELTLAWCGGFNNPQFSMGDLNNDGKKDLVVYEPFKGVKTFINTGVAGAPVYTYAPEYALNFPPAFNYLVLEDYNCDNIPDLFEEGATGFTVYKGYYNGFNRLCFTYYKELYYTNDIHSGGPVNAFNNPQDIPAIVDVDNDGDLDFISYDINGGYLNWYRNMRVEDGLPCDSIRVALWDRCWGKAFQGFYRTHILQQTCNNSGLHRGAARPTHSGNTPCLFDWDMDGDYDYLDGSVSFNEMTFMKNGRIEYGGVDSMVWQDTMWQTGGTTISLPAWPAAFNIDIDQDGKKDLLISPNAASASENYKCIWMYRNQTTPGSPNWQFMSDTFLIDKTIDAGTAAYPALFDYDKDGKPDLFVGSEGYYQSSGLMKSRVLYYHNTSTTGNPSFTLQSKDFLHIDTFHFQGTALTFGDIDGDGISDMIIGHTDGSLTYYKNMAAYDTVQPVFQPTQVTLTDEGGTAINVNGRATPFIYDIDKDGKKDLVIGSIYGTLQYYQNVSTTSGTIKLRLINTRLGNVKSDPSQLFGCYSTPFIGPIDSSGKDYLLMGSNSGNIYRFDSVASGDTAITYPMLESQYSFIDSTFLTYNHPASAVGVYGNLRSAPAVADIDGDGDYEMVVGTVFGGLNFYKRKIASNEGINSTQGNISVNVYPNPATNYVNVNWNGVIQPSLKLYIYDLQGRMVYRNEYVSQLQHASIDSSPLTDGVYIIVLEDGGRKYHSKLTVLH